MRDPIAIVEAAVDIAAIVREWDSLDAREEKTLAEIRLSRGRLLVRARQAWGASKKARVDGKTWGEFVAERKISLDTATRYMQLAGYVEVAAEKPDATDASSRKVRDQNPPAVPTYKEAGIVAPPPPAPKRSESACKECGETIANHLRHCLSCDRHTSSARQACQACGADMTGETATVSAAPDPIKLESMRAPLPDVPHDAALDLIADAAADVDKKATALQSSTQRLVMLLRQHEASIGGPKAALVRAAIVRAHGLIGECYQLTAGGNHGSE